jgi:hypothetical protein
VKKRSNRITEASKRAQNEKEMAARNEQAAQEAKNIQANYGVNLTNPNTPTVGAAAVSEDVGSVPGLQDSDPRRRRKAGLSSQLGINA